jgi:flagellar basal body P-ring protein FlgI
VQPSLLGLPAKVVADTRTGLIVVDGEVEISPTVITHKDLVIQTTVPTPEPTPAAPIVRRGRWTGIQTGANEPTLALLDDLLASFNQLDVPPADQIAILVQIHRAGNLHGKLIVDGIEL